jgi:hypothetical protein
MESEDKLYLSYFIVLCAVIVCLASLFHYSAYLDSKLVKALIEQGTDPIKARCAVSSFSSGNAAAFICQGVAR